MPQPEDQLDAFLTVVLGKVEADLLGELNDLRDRLAMLMAKIAPVVQEAESEDDFVGEVVTLMDELHGMTTFAAVMEWPPVAA